MNVEYVLNHGLKLAIYSAILFLVGFAATNLAFGALLHQRGAAWGVRSLADPAGFPMIILLLSAFPSLRPVSNTITRVTEAEADIFGLEPPGIQRVREGFVETGR